MVEVLLVGGIAERRGNRLELKSPPDSRLREILRQLSKLVPEAVDENGRPRPGFLIFLNGVDVRVLDPDEKVSDDSKLYVIQVYHGG